MVKASEKKTGFVRLYAKGIFVGFRRGKRTQDENQSLIKIEGVQDKKAATFYYGKRVAYVYSAKKEHRVIWGRIMKAHGSNGVVRARFQKNLPPRAMGARIRVMLYPSSI